ncbi:hypothetical protein ANAPC1_00317 [Anaplasma phagocytophilum]|uniref:Uncharacterized protein n=1 Tax=Anaplasma phagocytophilum TaxID=948 RepID=A0AA45ZH72_ANAPH|nr:hypothetical protein [Anaplasma phagocytophilum]SBO13977.1 hypothetical protein ANAPC1_00317 [Anaplasma phagocytophilum]
MHSNVRGAGPVTDQESQDVQYSFSPHSNQASYHELKRAIAQYNKSLNNPSVKAKPLLFRLLSSSVRVLANSPSSYNKESANKEALHELENVLNSIHLFYYRPNRTVFNYQVVLAQCCNALVHLCKEVSLLPPDKCEIRSNIDHGIALISCAIHLVHNKIEGTLSPVEDIVYTRDLSVTKHIFSFNNAAMTLLQTAQVLEYDATQRDMQVASCIARIIHKDSLYEYRIQLSQHLALRIDNVYSAILNRRPVPTFKHSFQHDIDLLNTAHTLLTNSLNKLSRRASKNISTPSSIALIQLDIFNCWNLVNSIMNNKIEHSYYFDSICNAFQPCPININRLRTVVGNAYLFSKISKYGRESQPVMETIQNNLESADKLLDNGYFSCILQRYPRSQYSELRKTVTSALETLNFFYFVKASSKHASHEKIPRVMSSSSHASDSKTLQKSALHEETSDKPSTSHLSLKTLKKIPSMLALKATENSRKKNSGPRSNALHVQAHTSEGSSNSAAEASGILTDHATSSALDIDFAARQSEDNDRGAHDAQSSNYR